MSGKALRRAEELKRLIREQECDQRSAYVFPERITPRRWEDPFPHLSLHQKTCLFLSHLLSHREIGRVLNISVHTVRTHLKAARKRQRG